MSLSDTAFPPRAENDPQLTFTFDDRHWRIRGLEKQLSCERLRVNLMVSRRELVHVDTLGFMPPESQAAGPPTNFELPLEPRWHAPVGRSTLSKT